MSAFIGELLTLARWQLLARAVILLAPLAVLAAADPLADSELPTAVLLTVVGLGALTAAFPDSHAGGVALVVLVWVWLARVDRTTSPWLLGAAVAVAAFHTAAALAAFAPPGATLDAAVRRRWARRFGLTVGVVVASWALIAGIDRADTGPNGPLFVAGLTALGAGALAFRRSGRPS
jgi:hypothetical protein